MMLLRGNNDTESTFRQLVYSILKIPKTAEPALGFFLNAETGAHLIRDIIAVLLLFERQSDPYLNAEALIHLLYSTKLSETHWAHIQKTLNNFVGCLFPSLKYAVDDMRRYEGAESEFFEPQWNKANVQIEPRLTTVQWRWLIAVLLDPGAGPDVSELYRRDDITENGERMGVAIARMTNARALGFLKWRSDGMLLPYGHPRDDFTVLNP
jgi:hypothetical protein